MSNDLESLEPAELDKITEQDMDREVPTSTFLIIKLAIIVVCFGISGYVFNKMFLSRPAIKGVTSDEIARLQSEIMVLQDQANRETGEEKASTLQVIGTLQAEVDKLIKKQIHINPPIVNPHIDQNAKQTEMDEGNDEPAPEDEDE